jgi:hypothetical protein
MRLGASVILMTYSRTKIAEVTVQGARRLNDLCTSCVETSDPRVAHELARGSDPLDVVVDPLPPVVRVVEAPVVVEDDDEDFDELAGAERHGQDSEAETSDPTAGHERFSFVVCEPALCLRSVKISPPRNHDPVKRQRRNLAP